MIVIASAFSPRAGEIDRQIPGAPAHWQPAYPNGGGGRHPCSERPCLKIKVASSRGSTCEADLGTPHTRTGMQQTHAL